MIALSIPGLAFLGLILSGPVMNPIGTATFAAQGAFSFAVARHYPLGSDTQIER